MHNISEMTMAITSTKGQSWSTSLLRLEKIVKVVYMRRAGWTHYGKFVNAAPFRYVSSPRDFPVTPSSLERFFEQVLLSVIPMRRECPSKLRYCAAIGTTTAQNGRWPYRCFRRNRGRRYASVAKCVAYRAVGRGLCFGRLKSRTKSKLYSEASCQR